MECAVTPIEPFEKFGANLVINNLWSLMVSLNHCGYGPLAVDCETDEKDNFVGIAITRDGRNVYYFTEINEVLNDILATYPLIGHNLKGDAKWLRKWGVPVQYKNLYGDTALMSYVVNSTKESHHLKDLGRELLGVKWTTYKEMVHPDPEKPHKKVTLDQQPVEKVAKYCASDAIVTWHLHDYFKKRMSLSETRLYQELELKLAQILFEMELTGISIDVPHLKRLDEEFGCRLVELHWQAVLLAQESGFNDFNVNSDKQLGEYLIKRGHRLPKTPKGSPKVTKDVLSGIKDPMVEVRLEYKKYKILHSTFVQGLLEREKDGRAHTTYNQISISDNGESYEGIATTRLSSSDPNLQNIPTRSETGKLIRKAFIASPGKTLIVADYSQIEYRLLAHFTKEKKLIEAFKNGKDVHTETGRALGCDRDTGKTLNFAAIYGAQAKKIAKTAKVTEKQAEDFLAQYWKILPSVTSWINRVKYEAKGRKGIFTMLKRWVPLPKIDSKDRFERFHYERAAVNYTIQGSAAEILKLAMIKLRENGYLPLLTVHDELIFEVDGNCEDGIDRLTIESRMAEIKKIMENIVKLDVPLEVTSGYGKDWGSAKH